MQTVPSGYTGYGAAYMGWQPGAGMVPVAAGGYVRPMEDHIIFVAGEPLSTLEKAVDQLEIYDLPCGCLGLDGTLPKLLSQCLARALKAIDAELTEWADGQNVEYQGVDTVRELLHRLGRRETSGR
jgi:hypothetical protein